MSDTYKGESPSKKLARLFLWDAMRQAIPGDGGKSLVLTSRECGDVSFLIGAGKAPGDIVAVDLVPEAATEVRRRFPGVHAKTGDVASISKKLPFKIRRAFIDFCGPVSRKTIDTFFGSIVGCAENKSVFAIGVMRGREGGRVGREITSERKAVNLWIETGKRDPALPDPSRGSVLDRELFDLGAAARCVPLPFHSMHYHSRTSDAGGVPMLIRFYRVYRETKGVDRAAFLQRAFDWWQPEVNRWNAGHGLGDWRTSGMCTEIVEQQMTDEKVRNVLLSMCDGWTKEQVPRPELLMNVSRGTLAAWKAHQTMGTYEKKGAA